MKIIIEIDKTKLAEEIKRRMVRARYCYPETDIEDVENLMSEQDVAQWLLGGLVETEDIEFD